MAWYHCQVKELAVRAAAVVLFVGCLGASFALAHATTPAVAESKPSATEVTLAVASTSDPGLQAATAAADTAPLPSPTPSPIPTPLSLTPGPIPTPAVPTASPPPTPLATSEPHLTTVHHASPPTITVKALPTSAPSNKLDVNPFSARPLYVDPNSSAHQQAEIWRSSNPDAAQLMDSLAATSQARWFGDWNSDIQADVRAYVGAAAASKSLPVLVVYNIPVRDCQGYSGGGAVSAAAYQQWIQRVAEGIAADPAVVILEPDALPLIDCLTSEQQTERYNLLSGALQLFATHPNVAVYLDAGNPSWIPAPEMATRLRRAGITQARGFSLNVSNFIATNEVTQYGQTLSSLTSGAHFVVDSSRNGLGPASGGVWCNPDGRALGPKPGATTEQGALDALLWIKNPGESDGSCNGGPGAGTWWPEYALGLVQRSVK